jgi:hypothetical protein
MEWYCGRRHDIAVSRSVSDLLTRRSPRSDRRWWRPELQHGRCAELKNGPAVSCLAADARGCIMVGPLVHRIQVCGAQIRANGGFSL